MTALTYLLLWGFGRAGTTLDLFWMIILMVFDYNTLSLIVGSFK